MFLELRITIPSFIISDLDTPSEYAFCHRAIYKDCSPCFVGGEQAARPRSPIADDTSAFWVGAERNGNDAWLHSTVHEISTIPPYHMFIRNAKYLFMWMKNKKKKEKIDLMFWGLSFIKTQRRNIRSRFIPDIPFKTSNAVSTFIEPNLFPIMPYDFEINSGSDGSVFNQAECMAIA